jgi:hypothetical protein
MVAAVEIGIEGVATELLGREDAVVVHGIVGLDPSESERHTTKQVGQKQMTYR